MMPNKATALTLAAVMLLSVPSQIMTTEAAGKDTSKLQVTKKNIVLAVGEAKSLSANKNVTWKSSNTKIAKVTKATKKKAKIIARKKGKCIITVKSSNEQVKVKVTIKAKTKPTKNSPIESKEPQSPATQTPSTVPPVETVVPQSPEAQTPSTVPPVETTMPQMQETQPPTPTPIYTSIEDINKKPVTLPHIMYFTVTKVSEQSMYLSSETNLFAKSYIAEKPDYLNIQEGTRLKMVNPEINLATENSENQKIVKYENIYTLGEGFWFQKPRYVKEISEGILYLANETSGMVTETLDLRSNEILVTKNGQYVTIDNIKVGSKLKFYVSSPVVVTMPGKIIDCTKIDILD